MKKIITFFIIVIISQFIFTDYLYASQKVVIKKSLKKFKKGNITNNKSVKPHIIDPTVINKIALQKKIVAPMSATHNYIIDDIRTKNIIKKKESTKNVYKNIYKITSKISNKRVT